jgi:hypothetical protein
MNNTKKAIAIARISRSQIGMVETGSNAGFGISKFQRAVDGRAAGESWCIGFVQWCVKEVDSLFDSLDFKPWKLDRSVLPQTEWSIALWEGTPKAHRLEAPEVGAIVVWQSLSNPNQGHGGVIVGVDNVADIVTVEGNTGSNLTGDQREGDGVCLKSRMGGNIPGFKRLGYLKPWL